MRHSHLLVVRRRAIAAALLPVWISSPNLSAQRTPRVHAERIEHGRPAQALGHWPAAHRELLTRPDRTAFACVSVDAEQGRTIEISPRSCETKTVGSSASTREAEFATDNEFAAGNRSEADTVMQEAEQLLGQRFGPDSRAVSVARASRTRKHSSW